MHLTNQSIEYDSIPPVAFPSEECYSYAVSSKPLMEHVVQKETL